ncbi:MAG: DinB family protein [Acidobacteriota bacterium]|nr:DinB family protein [Acidobacteriota bacterium]
MTEQSDRRANNDDAVYRRLVERLRRQGAEIGELTSELDDEALSRRTLPDKWSLKELVCHLWRLQRLFEDRIELMLTKDDPVLLPYTPDVDPDFAKLVAHDATETRTAFLAEREVFSSRLDRLEAAQWRRRGRHPGYTRFDVHFQIEYLVHHEAHHIYQLFQRRLQLDTLLH